MPTRGSHTLPKLLQKRIRNLRKICNLLNIFNIKYNVKTGQIDKNYERNKFYKIIIKLVKIILLSYFLCRSIYAFLILTFIFSTIKSPKIPGFTAQWHICIYLINIIQYYSVYKFIRVMHSTKFSQALQIVLIKLLKINDFFRNVYKSKTLEMPSR